MKSKFPSSPSALLRSSRGFSLIEIIVTLLLSAVLTALLLPLIGSGLEGSRRALLRLPKAQSLQTEMDSIWHLYRSTDPTDLPALRLALEQAAAANPPPPYTLISNDWVDFNSEGDEIDPAQGTEKVLRVTIKNDNGESLTSYFFPIP